MVCAFAGGMPMTRDELAALRDAIDTVLTWPDAVRAEVARWLTPAAKPNGRDPHPPPHPPTPYVGLIARFKCVNRF
jgi:hypothetical protein